MAPKTSTKPAAKADVRVYNISSQQGIAGRTADQLKQGGYNVTDVGNLSLPKVSTTTVYFGNGPGEKETADAVGALLKAPVQPRTPDVADQPPGVIVVVAS
jgi:cytochrome c peroxidase